MSPIQVVKYFGSQAQAARELNITRTAVWKWLRDKRIEYRRQCHIELVTGGKLKATR